MAERYAAALFDLADERRTLDEVAADLRQLRAMLAASADLPRLMRSPVLSRAEQGKAIAALARPPGCRRWSAIFSRSSRATGVCSRCRR